MEYRAFFFVFARDLLFRVLLSFCFLFLFFGFFFLFFFESDTNGLPLFFGVYCGRSFGENGVKSLALVIIKGGSYLTNSVGGLAISSIANSSVVDCEIDIRAVLEANGLLFA